jgi:signal transduction histidine kinase
MTLIQQLFAALLLVPAYSSLPAAPGAIVLQHDHFREAESGNLHRLFAGVTAHDRAFAPPHPYELGPPVAWMTAGAGPGPELAAKSPRSWWERFPHKVIWLYAVLSGLASGVVFFLWRGWSANRQCLAQQAFALRLLVSQEQDRKRIAAELHDGLGQNLILIKNRAELGLKSLVDGEQAADHLKEISALASQSLAETREIAYDLRPHQLDSLGLTKALKAMISHTARAAGLKLALELEPMDGGLKTDFEIHLYRIVQESLNNIVKHAAASEIRIDLRKTADRLWVRIQDDGCGLPVTPKPHEPAYGSGFGLVTIAERVKLLRGWHRWESAPGQGTTLAVEIPLTEGSQL